MLRSWGDFFFFNFYLFWEGDSTRLMGKGQSVREAENPQQAQSCQHRARCRAQTHKARRSWPEPKLRARHLTDWATHAPLTCSFLSLISCIWLPGVLFFSSPNSMPAPLFYTTQTLCHSLPTCPTPAKLTFPRQAAPNRTYCNNENVLCVFVLSNIVTTGHLWLLSTWNVASVTEELNFKFDFNQFKLKGTW